VGLDDLAADGEAQADAALVLGAGDLEEAVEDVLQVLGGDAVAGVFDGDVDAAFVRLGAMTQNGWMRAKRPSRVKR
jgi:hypothetical protein